MNKTVSIKQLREFGLLMGFGFPFLIGWLLPSLFGHEFRAWTFWIGMSALIVGLAEPRLLYYPYKGWMALGNGVGWVNSHILLGLVFLIVLQPIACVMKLRGYDPLRLKRNGEKTYRERKHNHQTDLTRIF